VSIIENNMKILLILLMLLPLHTKADELYCLAQNIYFEARSESLAGKYAVADVVLNRVASSKYPSTICSVITERHQFSWYWDGKSDLPRTASPAWIDSVNVARGILVEEKFLGITEGATHYHATYVYPSWASKLHKVGRIGNHIFYLEL
jgi:N-acetylmuramoyl-L-alanine amidase